MKTLTFVLSCALFVVACNDSAPSAEDLAPSAPAITKMGQFRYALTEPNTTSDGRRESLRQKRSVAEAFHVALATVPEHDWQEADRQVRGALASLGAESRPIAEQHAALAMLRVWLSPMPLGAEAMTARYAEMLIDQESPEVETTLVALESAKTAWTDDERRDLARRAAAVGRAFIERTCEECGGGVTPEGVEDPSVSHSQMISAVRRLDEIAQAE